MKICRDCSNVCEGSALFCPRCKSSNLAVVGEKLCNYCKSKVAVGTVICPHCHRVLPPESQDTTYQNIALTNVEVADNAVKAEVASVQAPIASENIHYVQPISHFASETADAEEVKATTFSENQEVQPIKAEKKEGELDEFDKKNPLFAIYDKAPDILPKKEEETAVPAMTYQETLENESLMADESLAGNFNTDGIIQTVEYNTKSQKISREQPKPQSDLPRYALFAFACLYTFVGLWCVYMVHDFGDVYGYEMICAILVDLRDVFPGSYPYILYGIGLLPKYEFWGSYMPFAIGIGMTFSLIGGFSMMISAIPKWVVAVLNFITFAWQLGGVWMMVFLFGTSTLGVGSYAFVVGSLAVAVLHLIFVPKVYAVKRFK